MSSVTSKKSVVVKLASMVIFSPSFLNTRMILFRRLSKVWPLAFFTIINPSSRYSSTFLNVGTKTNLV